VGYTTPSSIISFISEIENTLADIYRILAERFERHSEQFKKFEETCREDITKLDNIFKRTVTEMILEPITGVDLENIKKDLELDKLSEGSISRDWILETLSRLNSLYILIGKKLESVSPEAAMYIKNMAKKKEIQRKFIEENIDAET